MTKLTFTREPQKDGERVTFTGVLDENTGDVLQTIVVDAKAPLYLDCGEMRRINSVGVRSWIQFVKAMGTSRLVYQRCSPAFVEQLNTLSEFRGHAEVQSVLAPFLCEECGNVVYEEMVVGRDVQRGVLDKLPDRSCPQCRVPMIFDDIPERYLQFLAHI